MNKSKSKQFDRRKWIGQSLAGATAGLFASSSSPVVANQNENSREQDTESKAPPEDYKISNGRAKQSVMAWCFNSLPKEELISACAAMGLSAMEGIDKKFYPLMKENGLGVSLTGSHGFARGPVNPDNHEFCATRIREGIDLAVEWGAPGVITFTGMREEDISDEDAFKNCVQCWKSVIDYAEAKEVNVVLEMLNTRDDSHPMKGHPGYFGDDIHGCIEMIKAVDSPRMKLLFDIYHVQIMNGDVIRNFREYAEYISHVHTAGNPGRCELDEKQELNYPAIISAILDTGYDGYIAQEFIPTWDNPLDALRHGVQVCDVT